MKKRLDFQPKLFTIWKNYSKEKFFTDLMAGIIVGIVALPLAIAFGIASGVSPEPRVDYSYNSRVYCLFFRRE